ncbi:hypothetical protein QOT17_022172 [Balamuthia mandrillaris]
MEAETTTTTTTPTVRMELNPSIDSSEEQEDEFHGRAFLTPHKEYVVPLFPLHGVVLFPGETLPLKTFDPVYMDMIQKVLQHHEEENVPSSSPSSASFDRLPFRTFGVITFLRHSSASCHKRRRRAERDETIPEGAEEVTHRLASVGTTAVIQSICIKQPQEERHDEEDAENVNVVTVGTQRFQLFRGWMERNGMMRGKIRVLPETEAVGCCPSGAVSRLRQEGREKRRDTPMKITTVVNLSSLPLWVYHLYDADELARRAEKVAQAIVDWKSGAPHEPHAISFWLARNLPVDDSTRLKLLSCDNVCDRLRLEIHIMEKFRVIGCNQCGSVISNKADIMTLSQQSGPIGAFVNPGCPPFISSFSFPSTFSLFCFLLCCVFHYACFFFLTTINNPETGGVVHELVALRRARGLDVDETNEPILEGSWFPDYKWSPVHCEECGQHMGWLFTLATAENNHLSNTPEEPLSALQQHLPKEFWGIKRGALTHRVDPVQHEWEQGAEQRELEAVASVAAEEFLHWFESMQEEAGSGEAEASRPTGTGTGNAC